MTLETCKKRYDIAKEKGDKEAMDYWKTRIERKVKRHEKYKGVNVNIFLGLKNSDVNEDGKKSKG